MSTDTARLEWPTIKEYLKTATALHEFLKNGGRTILERYTREKVSVSNGWTCDASFLYVESWCGEDVGIALDPLGTYLRNGSPGLWVVAGLWDFEKLRRRLEENAIFGTHLYFHWDTPDEGWDFRMHPVSEIASFLPSLRAIESAGNEIGMDSFQFMHRITYDDHDLSVLEERVDVSVGKAAAFLGVKPVR